MIKTVSFAPPRAATPRSAAKTSTSPRKTSPRAASGSPSPQTTLEFGAPEAPAAEVKPAPKAKAKPANGEAPKGVAAPKTAATPKTVAKAKTVEAPKAKATKTSPAEPKAVKVAEAPASPKASVIKTGAEKLKGKRVYAPKDLAAQYGEKVVERPTMAIALETDQRKKRLTKAEREARRELMKPDESLKERLARATQITFKKVKSEPRGKGWKFECGRCGTTSYFQTPGGVCACGTIAVKELV